MGFTRRTNYDLNMFFGEARVAEDLELVYKKSKDGNVTPYVCFRCITNSSPYSSRTKCDYYLEAYGKRALRLSAMLSKGVGIWFKAELVNTVDVIQEKKLKQKIHEKYNCFRIESLHIISIPDQESKNETFTDVFYGVDQESDLDIS